MPHNQVSSGAQRGDLPRGTSEARSAADLATSRDSWLCRMMATVELCQRLAPEASATDAAISDNEMRMAIDHRCKEFKAFEVDPIGWTETGVT
jgi:hypothetical protein